MKRIFIYLAALAVAATASAQHFTPLHKLQFTERIIENFYVDTINSGKLVEAGIEAMLKTLDPHSAYSTPEETKALNEPLQGNFSGIGIQFNMSTDTVYVIQTVAGGPSERVGIQAGDRIIAANDTVIAGRKLTNTQITSHLRGPKGSEVMLTVLRKGVDKLLSFRVTRDDIPIYSVDAAYMATPEVGYVRISRFAGTTAEEFEKALKKLRKKGMKHLIIDLEDNTGGYMNSATDVAQLLLKHKDLIVYQKGNALPAQYFRSEGSPIMKDGRIVVMVNQNSASASEILSGAIQDQDRGLIVGRRTFGKGLVQRPFPMPDGSMIRLTVARYYTPAGRSIQKPYTAGDSDEYYKDIYNRYRHGELSSADSIHQSGELFHTLRHHRPIYGGGGITPDLFVPVDTSTYSDYYRDLVAKGIINKYVLNLIDRDRKLLLKKYPTEDSFVSGFDVTPAMLGDIVAMGEADSIPHVEKDWQRSLPAVRLIVKGLISRDLYENASYFRVANPLNTTYQRALELITDERRYDSLLNPEGK